MVLITLQSDLVLYPNRLAITNAQGALELFFPLELSRELQLAPHNARTILRTAVASTRSAGYVKFSAYYGKITRDIMERQELLHKEDSS